MLATNELRINNWVYVIINSNIKDIKPVRLGRVKAISTNIVIEYPDSKDPLSSTESSITIEPVILSREWLKRAHFQNLEDSEKCENLQFNRFEVIYYKEKRIYYCNIKRRLSQ